MDVREVADSLLVSVDLVDLNVLDATTNLFTVPAGKSCIITKVVTRTHSAALTTAVSDYGFNANGDDVITGVIKALTGATDYQIVVADDAAIRGVAAGVFKHSVQIDEGGALTCTVDVFGYLY